jgi:hypothetical protein
MKNRILMNLMIITASIGTMQGMENTKDSSVYKAPETMHPLKAFIALYYNAEVIDMGAYAPNSGKPFDTLTEAEQVFLAACPNKYCDYVRGKCMKVDFSKYPELQTKQYNSQYGTGVAEKVLINHASDPDIEAYKPLAHDPCSMFTPEHLKNMAPDVKIELSSMIKQCKEKAKSSKPINDYSKIENCEARFMLGADAYDAMPCKKAAKLMKRTEKYDKNQGKPNKTSVKNMLVCGNKKTDDARYKCHFFALFNIADAQKIINQMDGDKQPKNIRRKTFNEKSTIITGF